MELVNLKQFMDVTGLKLVTSKQFFDVTGFDLYYSLPKLLKDIEVGHRFCCTDDEVISQAMQKYEQILKSISITAHESPGEPQLKP